jgi:hypothetical protein
MSIQLTQIPAVISELADLPTKRLNRDLLRLYRHTLPELFNSITFLCSTTSARPDGKPKFDFGGVVADIESRLSGFLKTFKVKYIGKMIKQILEAVPEWRRKPADSALNGENCMVTRFAVF